MELTKNRITTTNLKAAKYVEFTVDDDFNVPDVKGDIDRQIASKGQVTIENIDVMEGKARITGTVSYAILYQTDREGYSFESHDGELPFEETINADELSLGDKVSVQGVLEDLYVTVINSRKYEVRGLLGVPADHRRGRRGHSKRRWYRVHDGEGKLYKSCGVFQRHNEDKGGQRDPGK